MERLIIVKDNLIPQISNLLMAGHSNWYTCGEFLYLCPEFTRQYERYGDLKLVSLETLVIGEIQCDVPYQDSLHTWAFWQGTWNDDWFAPISIPVNYCYA